MPRKQDNDKHRPWLSMVSTALLLCLLLAAPAMAQYSTYKPNPDTAPNRQDNQMGTGGQGGGPKLGKDPVTGDTYMETAPRPKPEDQQPSGNQTFDVDVIYPGFTKKKK